MDTASKSLLSIINNILDLSNLESDNIELSLEQTNINKLITELSKIFSFQTSHKSISQHLLLEEMPILILDKLKLRQIIFNILSNAVKFTSKGTIAISSSFEKTDSHLGTLRISVEDTGTGIDSSDLKKIFEPFVKLSSQRGTSGSNSGTGLSLAISNKILHQLNGHFELESKLNEGSKFTIVLENVKHIETESKKLEKRYNKEVLIVDDLVLNLKVLAALLNKFGIKSTQANSAKDALKILQTKKFDALLTDIWMPEMNGQELAQKVRVLYPTMPILAITADIVYQNNFDKNAFDNVVTKPINSQKFETFFEEIFQ